MQMYDFSREVFRPTRREKVCLQKYLNHKSYLKYLKPRSYVEWGALFQFVVDGFSLWVGASGLYDMCGEKGEEKKYPEMQWN